MIIVCKALHQSISLDPHMLSSKWTSGVECNSKNTNTGGSGQDGTLDTKD